MLSDPEGLTVIDIIQVSMASKLLTDLNEMTCIERKGKNWKRLSSSQRCLISMLMRRQEKSLIVQECPSA